MSQSLSARRARSRRRQKRVPFGMIAAMLTACVATLIGVVCGLEPFVVLVRAVVSAIGMGKRATGTIDHRNICFARSPNAGFDDGRQRPFS